MAEGSKSDFGWRARHLRVETQVRLRWLAIGGQLAAVIIVHTLLGLSLIHI